MVMVKLRITRSLNGCDASNDDGFIRKRAFMTSLIEATSSDMSNFRRAVWPLSHVGACPPWLVIAVPCNPVIRVDARHLDRIDHLNTNLVITVGDVDVSLEIADGEDVAAAIAANLRPFVRCSPIDTSEVCQVMSEFLESSTHSELSPIVVFIGDDPIYVREEFVNLRGLEYPIANVESYATRGLDLPLVSGGIQAAIVLLTVEAGKRVAPLSSVAQRISDYKATID
jgi:hypothetical protein